MKAKKHLSILLALLLLISNFGLAFNVHYCGDSIASVSVNPTISLQTEKGCCEKIESKKVSCCKDKVFNFNKKSDNATLKAFSFSPLFTFILPKNESVLFSKKVNFNNTNNTSYYCDANAPPFYKMYSQYIFYA